MNEDAEVRDEEKAALYVVTVRPAMAPTRYVSAEPVNEQPTAERECDERGDGVVCDAHSGSGDEAGTGEGGDGVETGEGAGPTNSVDSNESKDGEQQKVTDTGEFQSTVPTAEGTDEEPSSDEKSVSSVAVSREERKKLRKQKKRRSMKVRLAKRLEAERQAKNEKQSAIQERLDERQRVATETLKLHEAKERTKTTAESEEKPEQRATARVSLVKQRGETRGEQRDHGVQEVGEHVGADDGLPTAVMELSGVRRQVKLDSGARYTIAGPGWMKYGDKVDQAAPVEFVEGIGGFLLDVIGVWKFRMRSVFGEDISVEACIVKSCGDEFLLGVDFLQSHGATMDFERNEIRYSEEGRAVVVPFRTYGGKNKAKVAAVRMARGAQLEGETVAPVEVAVTAEDGEVGVFLPTKQTGAVMLAATVTTVRDGKAWVPAINAKDSGVRLPSKRELGTWIPMDQEMQVLSMSGGLKRSKVKEWLKSLGENTEKPLDDEKDVNIGVEDKGSRDLILRLLRVYRQLTESTGDCPPATALSTEHHIDTGDAAPIMLKRRRQAQAEDAIIDENVDKMLKSGVIEEGNGAWGFPVVLVQKKDGEVRFCVDYRALNKVTRKDVYPLPRIDETLEALGGAILFSTLDLKAGYWQILMAAADKVKTAFTTKRGLYQFVRMPFGLCNAPSTFQRMMNSVLRGLTWSTCLVYLDDIVVYTRGGIEQHMLELACVLERLATAGLTLKLKKCVFATRRMEYLGHELSSDGVRPLQRLVDAVREFPKPQDAVEVKRFVHLAGYYRRFIEGFGSLMAPMTKLLRKTAEWEWGDEQQDVFERVKDLLTNKPLLIYPNFQLPFRVVTDASKVGLGACLMQDHGVGWQPVAFASKVNSETESKYGITELELAAVVWSIKLFRPYLYGRRFNIVTDHAALKWLMTSTNLTGKLHRWALTLQEFDFEVVYRPGSTNVVADALSRAPTAKAMTAIGRRRRARRLAADRARTAAEHERKRAEQLNEPANGRSRVERGVQSAQRRETRVRSEVGDEQAAEDAEARERRAASIRAHRERRGAISARGSGVGALVPKNKALRRASSETVEVRGVYERQAVNSEEQIAMNASEPRGRPVRANSEEDERVSEGPAVTMAEERRRAARRGSTSGAAATNAGQRDSGDHEWPIRGATSDERAESAANEARGSEQRQERVAARRVEERARGETLQLDDDEIIEAQKASRLVQRLVVAKERAGMKIEERHGLVVIQTEKGWRIVLPPALWPIVFKENHDSVWAGHLRAPHTFARISQSYWWPSLLHEVKQWVRGCQECGSRKARPRETIPPLRSIRGGDVGDRWALDVAGPLPTSDGGERFVIAAVEYVTRYAVAVSVKRHTAEAVADFMMKNLVLRFGVFREILTDGAPELTGHAVEELVMLLQAQQTTAVPYRPQIVGLVERFNRTWKDIVATYMQDESQRDWDRWVDFAVYAYNSGQHSTVKLSPNELMMGRKLRSPNDLLRKMNVTEAGELSEYHKKMVAAMESSLRCAEVARAKEQARQARYYDRRVRQKKKLRVGDRVWMFRPPRGADASKFVHQWVGPMRVVEPVGYDNWLVRREDVDGEPEWHIAHVSFLIAYHKPIDLLKRVAADLEQQLEYEGAGERVSEGEAAAKVVRAAEVPTTTPAQGRARERDRQAARGAATWRNTSDVLVETRRRKRRNRAGQYVLEHELRTRGAVERWRTGYDGEEGERWWVSTRDYDQLLRDDRVVEDSGLEEGV